MFPTGDFAVYNGPQGQCSGALCVPECKTCDVSYRKICVLGKLHLGLSYTAVGREFNATVSTIYIK